MPTIKMLAIVALSLGVLQCASAQQAPTDPVSSYGGDHEFGAVVGHSPAGGPIWGYDQNVRYTPIILRYSYLLTQHKHWAARYSPEVTALAILHELSPSLTDPQRVPSYHFGSGFSPEGFQIDFRPGRKYEPFMSNNGGFIYFADRVLSPEGSQFMYTIDFGAGVNIFLKRHQAITIGYRYQHLSNADISHHNPGTDADTFYIGFSRFHTKGVR